MLMYAPEKRMHRGLNVTVALIFVAAAVAVVWALLGARERPRREAEAALAALNAATRAASGVTGIDREQYVHAAAVSEEAREKGDELMQEKRYSEAAAEFRQAEQLYLALQPSS